MRLLMRLQHNNIIRYYGLTKFQPSGKCAVVYEQLCNATLHEAIHNPTIMLDHEARPPLFCHHHMLYGEFRSGKLSWKSPISISASKGTANLGCPDPSLTWSTAREVTVGRALCFVSEQIRLTISKEVADAMHYMHTNQKVHGNLVSSSIFVEYNFNAKVTQNPKTRTRESCQQYSLLALSSRDV
eukprot:1182912-Prorocentrum_minimum.AAC.1